MCIHYHIVRALLIHGVEAYLVALIMLVPVGIALGPPDSSRPSFWALLIAFLAVISWSLVGITRSAFRTISDRESGIALKAFSIVAMLLVIVVIVINAPDVARVVRTLGR